MRIDKEAKNHMESSNYTSKTFYVLNGSKSVQLVQKGYEKDSIICYYCENVDLKIRELLRKIKEKRGIDLEIVQNKPWDEEDDREVYEKYLKELKELKDI